jgi:hypothetical protein
MPEQPPVRSEVLELWVVNVKESVGRRFANILPEARVHVQAIPTWDGTDYDANAIFYFIPILNLTRIPRTLSNP